MAIDIENIYEARIFPQVAHHCADYHLGNGREKSPDDLYYSILTLNACMMGEDLPTRYGGMIPAAERIDRLANFLLRQNADIYLGQELMRESGTALYEKVKHAYTHAWVGIGKVPGKEESGLLVLSKRPLAQPPIFYPFSDGDQVDKKFFPNGARFMERGFFALDFGKFWVVTTHLEGGGEIVSGPAHRIRQMQLLTEVMDREIARGKPYVVMGDLNLERRAQEGDEYSRSNIRRDYTDFYTEAHPEFDETTYTCTNLFTAQAKGEELPEESRHEIDDYVLIRKPFHPHFSELNVELIETYDVAKPREEAITDHKAYKATFQFKNEP